VATEDNIKKRIVDAREEAAIRKALAQGVFDSFPTISSRTFDLNKQRRGADLQNANEYTAQLAALDEQELEDKRTTLLQEIADAKKAGDESLVAEKELALKRIDLKKKQKTEEAKLQKAAFEKNKRASITQASINTALAVGNALATVRPFVPAALIAAGVAGVRGGTELAVIKNQPVPEFAQGGIVSGLNAPQGNEDGIIAAQNGESVLTRQATAILGSDAINALYTGLLKAVVLYPFLPTSIDAVAVSPALPYIIGTLQNKLSTILSLPLLSYIILASLALSTLL